MPPRKSTQPPLALIVIGGFIAFLSLVLNQYLDITVNVASIFSPSGSQFSIYGFRIKHWIVGVALSVLSFGFYSIDSKKSTVFKQAAFVVLGMGLFLIIDEYTDVFRFISTGEYP